MKPTLPPPVLSITALQKVIIEEFTHLEGDRESMLTYIIELGTRLAPMNPTHKNEHNLIQGCMAKVWLTYMITQDRLFFEGDSNTAITKGLISLLLRVFSGQRATDIVKANLFFLGKLNILGLVGAQRASGLAQMIKKIKLIAITKTIHTNVHESIS